MINDTLNFLQTCSTLSPRNLGTKCQKRINFNFWFSELKKIRICIDKNVNVKKSFSEIIKNIFTLKNWLNIKRTFVYITDVKIKTIADGWKIIIKLLPVASLYLSL